MNSLRLSLLGLLAGAASSSAVVLVDETFADGNRSTQNPPASLAWYLYGATGYSSSVTANTWEITPATNTPFGAIGYFTASGSPTALTVGQTMTLSFNISYATAVTGGAGNFRFALFDSGGTRISSDLTSSSDAAFNSDRGYASFYTLSTDSDVTNGYRLRERTNDNDSLWTAGAFSTLGTNGDNNVATTNDVLYAATLTLEYVSPTQMTVTSNVNGNILSRTDSSPYTTFDSIAFSSNGTNGTVNLSNIEVTVVPEPGTCLLAGLGFGLLLWRRSRCMLS